MILPNLTHELVSLPVMGIKAREKARQAARNQSLLAATVGPEDLACGDYVAPLHEICELPSFYWTESTPFDREGLVRLRCLPQPAPPLKVAAVCLPFVFVKSPHGSSETIDIRRTQLVRLDEQYGKTVWKTLRKQLKPSQPSSAASSA